MKEQILIDALKELIELKYIKDNQGKTEDYLRRQPIAWANAKKVVMQYTLSQQEGQPVPVSVEEAAEKWAQKETAKVDFINPRERIAYYNGQVIGFIAGSNHPLPIPSPESDAVEFADWIDKNCTKSFKGYFLNDLIDGKVENEFTIPELYNLFKPQKQ